MSPGANFRLSTLQQLSLAGRWVSCSFSDVANGGTKPPLMAFWKISKSTLYASTFLSPGKILVLDSPLSPPLADLSIKGK
jgi:hypothetical protein